MLSVINIDMIISVLTFPLSFMFCSFQIIMLVLAWKLEAESMGFFTKEEWLKGMTSLQ